VFYIAVFEALGVQLLLMSTLMTGYTVGRIAGHGSLECKIPRLPLPPGRYRVNVSVVSESALADRIEAAALFDVTEGCFFPTSTLSSYGSAKVLVDHEWRQGSCI
jgi:lipopolysaccharide transport system ATP-binding protein